MTTEDRESEHEIITKADVQRLDRITREILVYKRRMEESAFQIGSRLLEVKEDELFRVRHETFNAYLAEEILFHRGTAFTYKRLAAVFDEREFETYGVTKLKHFYPRLWNVDKEARAAVLARKVAVETREGKVQRKALGDLTTDELRWLKNDENDKKRAKEAASMPDGPLAERFVAEARVALEDAHLQETAIDSRPGKDGEGFQISISGVDLPNAARTFGILQKVARDVVR
jgi:hypothetical protein